MLINLRIYRGNCYSTFLDVLDWTLPVVKVTLHGTS